MLGGHTLCLSMIVKDEAPVIARCLHSALPFIDSWVIVDTGSTDGTQTIIREALADIPGELLEREWVDFATNRNQALVPALDRATYVLILDADEFLDVAPTFAPRTLEADSYVITLRRGAGQAVSRRIIRSGLPWTWVGVLHEYLDCPTPTVTQRLPGLVLATTDGGARNRNPHTHEMDLATLRRALETDPGNARYRFFLAQTAYDAGDYQTAADAWDAFLPLAGDQEERFHALLLQARCLERLGKPWPAVQAAYMTAWAADPHRAEPCVHLAEHYVTVGAVGVADVFLRHAYTCPVPLTARLPVDLALHQWLIPIRYAACCASLGRLAEALTLVNRTLGSADLPPELRQSLLHQQAQLLTALTSA